MADPQKVNKWVKFVGSKIGRWKDLLDDINVDQVPLEYVVEIRYHHTSGAVNTHVVNEQAKNLGDDISIYVKQAKDLKAVEFIVDIDKINSDIGQLVKNLLNYSQEDQ